MAFSKIKTKSGAFWTAITVHATLLALLTFSSIMVNEPQVIPEVAILKIGEQEIAPPELALSGEPDQETDVAPPVGAEKPVEDPNEKPKEAIIDPMLPNPEEPPPEQLENNPAEGLPGEPAPPTDPMDGLFGPKTEAEQGIDTKGVPELFGEKLEGKTVLMLDVSGSMVGAYRGTTRLEVLILELINAISLMNEDDEFDVVIFGGDLPSWEGNCKFLWGSVQTATEEKKQEALNWIDTFPSIAGGSTPTYNALKYVCNQYPPDLDNMVLVTDGYPNNQTSYDIIKEAPEWFEKFDDCKMVCVSIGDDGLNFILRLAETLEGVYSPVEVEYTESK